MVDIAHLLGQGVVNLWLFIPSAILLGALHGLEPGHSKTMMAAFIVAVRGTVGQAVLLGLSATVSHTAVVWAVALGGLYFGRQLNLSTSEPYFQLASAAIMIGVAVWMVWRIRRDVRAHDHHDHAAHDDHDHDHDHGDHHHDLDHPHATGALTLPVDGFQDAHERAHAKDIGARFADRKATTGQIIVFGLTGGLIPCPASITVLLLCLQLKQIALGATLVLCFSLGLAATMVSVGVVAALGLRHMGSRWSGGFATFARRAPYVSAGLISIVGLVLAGQALSALAG